MQQNTGKILKAAEKARLPLTEAIYSTVTEEPAWKNFLQQIVTTLDARSARLLVLDKAAVDVRSSYKVGIDDSYHQQYVDYFVNQCPWRPELKSKPAGKLYSTYLDFSCSQKNFHRSEFYHDWARPQEIEHGLCGTVWETQDTTVQLLIQRTSEPGYFRSEERAFVNSLTPHIRQACVLRNQIETIDAKAQLISTTAENTRLPFLLLDKHRKVTYCSKGAEELLREPGNQLRLRNDYLYSQDSHLDNQLQTMIQRALQSGLGDWNSAGGRMTIENRDERRDEQLSINIIPVKWEGAFKLLSDCPVFAGVYFNRVDHSQIFDETLLKSLYQLSKAEICLTRLLAEGQSLPTAARNLGKSIHTIRSQTKSIYAKTAVKTQAELIRLLLIGSA